MPDITSEAILKVNVQGEEQIAQLAAAFTALGKQVTAVHASMRPAAVTAAGANAKRETAAAVRAAGRKAYDEVERNAKSLTERIAYSVGHAMGTAIRKPFAIAATAISGGIRMFASAISPLLG